MCGHEHEVTRQLVDERWDYRRSGLLGAEKNELEPKDDSGPPRCEVDFVWIIPRPYPRKTVMILGECKDEGALTLADFERDLEHLRRVADALPRKRFKTFVLFAKLAPFTPEEIEKARLLNDQYRQRVILLSARELEPYHLYERVEKEFGIKSYGGSPEDMAEATVQLYFSKAQNSESKAAKTVIPAPTCASTPRSEY